MQDTAFPILHLELHGVKKHIAAALSAHSDELAKMVGEEMDKQLSEESIRNRIAQQVRDLVAREIDAMVRNPNLARIIQDMLADAAIKALKANFSGEENE